MVPETWDEVWQTVRGDEEALIETVWEEGNRCSEAPLAGTAQ